MCVVVLLLVLFGVDVVCGGCWLWLVVVLALVSLCFGLLRGCWGFAWLFWLVIMVVGLMYVGVFVGVTVV